MTVTRGHARSGRRLTLLLAHIWRYHWHMPTFGSSTFGSVTFGESTGASDEVTPDGYFDPAYTFALPTVLADNDEQAGTPWVKTSGAVAPLPRLPEDPGQKLRLEDIVVGAGSEIVSAYARNSNGASVSISGGVSMTYTLHAGTVYSGTVQALNAATGLLAVSVPRGTSGLFRGVVVDTAGARKRVVLDLETVIH